MYVKRQKNAVFLLFIFFLIFFTIYTFVDLMKITMCFKQLEARHIISLDGLYYCPDFKLNKKLFYFMRYDILKIVNSKYKKVWIRLLSECKDILNIFFFVAYYDSLLPIGSDEITKRLRMWLNNL